MRTLLSVPLVLALVAGARATQTDPVLEIASATRVVAPAGTLVRIDALFPAEDLVQRAVPMSVLVRDLASGTHYARFDMGGVVAVGDAPSLADGLDPGDVFALLASGTPLAGARLLAMDIHRIEVLLPPGFDASNAEVQIFVIHEGDPLLSNPAPIADGGLVP